MIHEIGNRPAYEVLVETFEALSDTDKEKTVETCSWAWWWTSISMSFIVAIFSFAISSARSEQWRYRRWGPTACRADPAGSTPMPAPLVRILMNRYIAPVKHWRMPPCLAAALLLQRAWQNLFGASDHDAGLVQHHLGKRPQRLLLQW